MFFFSFRFSLPILISQVSPRPISGRFFSMTSSLSKREKFTQLSHSCVVFDGLTDFREVKNKKKWTKEKKWHQNLARPRNAPFAKVFDKFLIFFRKSDFFHFLETLWLWPSYGTYTCKFCRQFFRKQLKTKQSCRPCPYGGVCEGMFFLIKHLM